MKTLALLTLPFLLAGSSNAQIMGNGRIWVKLSASGKMAYLAGFLDGTRAGSGAATAVCQAGAPGISPPPKELCDVLIDHGWELPRSVHFPEDMVRAVDSFFSSPENLNLRISDAIGVFFMSVRGAPRSQIDDWISQIRRALNN